MTATATPTNQAVSEWVKIFPRQATENYTSSVTFMKQLTVVAVSTLTYLKNAFPEDSYTAESFGGVKLRILKKKCRDEVAQFLSTALTQAFEAFDKKYLHKLALCFYEDECKLENLIEYHIFEYSYKDDGVTMNVHSKNRDNVKHTMKYSFENLRERTIHLIRACVVIMQTCQNELPSSYDISIRLYYNEDAPVDYQAPGYLNSTEDHLSVGDTMNLGYVETRFHRLQAKSYIRDHLRASHEAIPSQNPPMISNDMDLSGSGIRSLSENEMQVVCSCNKTDVEEGDMLTCQYCNTSQHAACYGVRARDAARHCCVACSDADAARAPADAHLAALVGRKRESLSIFRRTLAHCARAARVSAGALAQRFRVSDANALKLMKLLYSHQIVAKDPDLDASPQTIMGDQLKLTKSKYFNTKEENIIDRLLAETFSQESVSDPLTDVLSPLEKVSINVPQEKNVYFDDPTLKEYRDALPTDNIEEPETNIAQTVKRSVKRKINNDKPVLRTGVRTKRTRALP
ncbi:unnamed protein product, partial [Brenthis ino]